MSRVSAFLWRLLAKLFASRGLHTLTNSCLRQAIKSGSKPDYRSLFELGRLLIHESRHDEARPLLEEAVVLDPKQAQCWNLLGVTRRETGDMEGARLALERAIALDQDNWAALNNFGNWLLASGEPEQAITWFDKALSRAPDAYEALNNRVVALLDLGKARDAEHAARHALSMHPDSAPLYLNLGNSLLQLGNGYQAIRAFQKALEIVPGFEEAHFNLSLLGEHQGLGNAIGFLKREIANRGPSVDLLNRLAIASMSSQKFLEAEKISRQILLLAPNFVPALVGLGNVLSTMGDTKQALYFYELAFQREPRFLILSNILFELNYFDELSSRVVFERHLEWARQFEKPLLSQAKNNCDDRKEFERIKIGYVSADFHKHPVGFLTKGFVPEHDRALFEVHCFAHVVRVDFVTEKLRNGVEHWHDTVGLSDDEVADLIRRHNIDILVDLSGHTANHRLLTFARKPAPIQISWIGYFHSTGMESIDYFITDPYSSPKGCSQYFSETPLYLPNSRFCYSPPEYVPPVSLESPYIKNGYVTFGCFNKLAKMTDKVVDVWASILKRLPNSRLWLKSPALIEEDIRDITWARFAAHGISSDRIILRQNSSHDEMLAEYGEIDIALDPFPFTGGITTLEALLMGVPVVTLAGESLVARQSAALLNNLQIPELIASSPNEYIECAITLATDSSRFIALRQTLRPVLEQSPICDRHQFCRDLETLYGRMWSAWSNNTKLPSDLNA